MKKFFLLMVVLSVLAMSSGICAAPFVADYTTDTSADYTVFNWWNESSTDVTFGVDTGLQAYKMYFSPPPETDPPDSDDGGTTTTWMQATHKTARLGVGETLHVQLDMSTAGGQEWSSAGITVATAEGWYAWMPNGINVFRQNNIDGCHMHAENFAGSVPAGEFANVATAQGYLMTNFWIQVEKTAVDTLAVSYSDDGSNYISLGNSVNAAYAGDLYVGLRGWRDNTYEGWDWPPSPQTIQAQTIEIVPEPATLSLLALGALAAIRRRRA